MARPAKFSEEVREAARTLVKEAQTARELRKGLSVTIPCELGVKNHDTAEILAVGVATVVRMQKELRDQVQGTPKKKGSWGGRRRQLMSLEEEKEFLEPWVQKAEEGGVLVVPPIHAALEERLGRQVAASTVYRMLARHGWRKVAPDTCHPKRDEQAQEEFKKNSQKYWRKQSKETQKDSQSG
jgi:transposase